MMESQSDLFNYARQKRDEGMTQVEINAGLDFSASAQNFILDYLTHNPPTSCEVIVNACKRAGIIPHNDHAFGPVFLKLFKRGLIIKAGITRRFKGHLAPGANIWAKK